MYNAMFVCVFFLFGGLSGLVVTMWFIELYSFRWYLNLPILVWFLPIRILVQASS